MTMYVVTLSVKEIEEHVTMYVVTLSVKEIEEHVKEIEEHACSSISFTLNVTTYIVIIYFSFLSHLR